MKPRIKARVLEEWRGLPQIPFTNHNAKPIGEILPAILGKLGLQERIREDEILNCWREIVGDFLAQHATPAGLRQGVLEVRVVQSTVYFELERNLKPGIVRKLQARFGRNTVRGIRFRIG
jgi:predicted nucleic acid-binding Zn ribbon protein